MRKLNTLFNLTLRRLRYPPPSYSSSYADIKPTKFPHKPFTNLSLKPFLRLPNYFPLYSISPKLSPLYQPAFRSFSTSRKTPPNYSETDQDSDSEEWEEESDTEPEYGDGGAGGGIVLQNVPWGEAALSIALEVLKQFGDGIKLYAFKATPRGYIYIRLDKLSEQYGCPTMEEIENYSREYTKRLEEERSKGLIAKDLAVEVSSPGANRLLRVPEDLHRYKDFPMVVSYLEADSAAKVPENTKVFFLDVIESESESCIWRLADVKENKDPASKGRPMNRKQRDWRLKLQYSMLKKVALYLT